MRGQAITKPCEFCGAMLSKTKTEQGPRKYWTCNRSCANKLRIQLGNTPNWQQNPLRGQKGTRPCAQCGKPVTRYLAQRRLDQEWTCSKSCRAMRVGRRRVADGTWKRPIKPRTGTQEVCEVCGKEFYRTPTAIKLNQGRFCSVACHNEGQRKPPVVKVCALTGCDKELVLKPSQAERQYCSRAHWALGTIKRPEERMHNGKPARRDKFGYLYLWEPEHPNKVLKGWQPEHRLIMERQLGRYLRSDEHVDHKNQQKDDNRPENLQVLSHSEHSSKTGKDQRENKARMQAELAELRAMVAKLEDQLRE